MKAKIYCRTIEKGRQAFYLIADKKEYYLFTQNYRVSVKKYFAKGVGIYAISDYKAAVGEAVRHTLDKLAGYVDYVEKEYGIAVMEKTKQRAAKNGKARNAYKREAFRLSDYLGDYCDEEFAFA